MNKWLQAITDVRSASFDVVPKGWLTTKDIAKEIGCSAPHATKYVRALVEAGRAEKKIFRLGRPIPHYRLK